MLTLKLLKAKSNMMQMPDMWALLEENGVRMARALATAIMAKLKIAVVQSVKTKTGQNLEEMPFILQQFATKMTSCVLREHPTPT